MIVNSVKTKEVEVTKIALVISTKKEAKIAVISMLGEAIIIIIVFKMEQTLSIIDSELLKQLIGEMNYPLMAAIIIVSSFQDYYYYSMNFHWN